MKSALTPHLVPHPVSRRGITLALACGVPTALLAGCAHASAGTPAQAAMRKLEAAYLDAWSRHDADAVAACYHPEAVRWTVSNPAGARGAAILAETRAVFAIYPDLAVENVKVEPIGESRLVKQYVFKGTWRGRFPSGPLASREPSGRAFAAAGVQFLEFRDALIVSSHAYWDRLSVLTQIGAVVL